jgi:tyrosyl-tRNA synthetase
LTTLSGCSFDFEIVNNADFYKDMSFLKFLRDVGKYITVNTMMNKESVKRRIEDPDQSISYTEFSYMLIQGYDFVHLLDTKGVQMQICGSDQRGNGVTGIELIRKKLNKDAFVFTSPLLLDSTGKKFGKSE